MERRGYGGRDHGGSVVDLLSSSSDESTDMKSSTESKSLERSMTSLGDVDWVDERQGPSRIVNRTLGGGGLASFVESESESVLEEPLRKRLRF